MDAGQYRLEIRFGDALLEDGFTPVPNLFRKHYADLGLSDAAAMWVIHLLSFKWSEKPCWPKQGGLPMSANEDTRRGYARLYRRKGLLFTHRRYYTRETVPSDRPELAGKIESLEYYFDSLFHNVVRVAAHLAAKKPLADFLVEIPGGMVRQVVNGYFQDVPRTIKAACERHALRNGLGPGLLCDFHILEKHILEKRIDNYEEASLKEESMDDDAALWEISSYFWSSGISVNQRDALARKAREKGYTPEEVRRWSVYIESLPHVTNPAGLLYRTIESGKKPDALEVDLAVEAYSKYIAGIEARQGAREAEAWAPAPD